MEQDGRVDHAVNAKRPTDALIGKIILTLCVPSSAALGYRHAIIPFPSSYEAACAEALKTFAAYIPADVETVSLRQAIQRRYGQAVWSIIPEDSWDTALEKSGEEIGVFLPDVPPESVPYQQAPKKLVRFQYIDPTDDEPVSVIKAVGALKECADFRDALCRQKGWPRYSVHYDSRMVGTEREQVFYKTHVSSPESKPDWCVLQKSDPEMFSILLAKHSEPMAIYLAPK